MTQKEKQLARISLRGDQVLAISFEKLPTPPEAMLKLPGVREWWAAMQISDERRIQAFYRLANNIPPTTHSG